MGGWLTSPQEGAAPDPGGRGIITSQGGPGGHFSDLEAAREWITGTEIRKAQPELAEKSSWNQLLAHPLGDFPQDKTNVLHIEDRGQGTLGHGEFSVTPLPCGLSV